MNAKYFIMVMALCSANFSLFAMKNQVKVYHLHENQKEYIRLTMKLTNAKHKLTLPTNSLALGSLMLLLVNTDNDNNKRLKTINTHINFFDFTAGFYFSRSHRRSRLAIREEYTGTLSCRGTIGYSIQANRLRNHASLRGVLNLSRNFDAEFRPRKTAAPC